ncbi:hypothetical protein KGY71_01725 [Candidatus Bipolaricaulota bacterium]|nr:hypothetical protein [Candidatus Bipolaricaulota bacterium]
MNSSSVDSNRVEVQDVEAGPETIESTEDEERAVPHLVKLAKKFEVNYDAFIIGCYSDLGIQETRKAVTVPVIGPVRASFAAASVFTDSFGLLTINEDVLPGFERKAAEIGLREQLTELRAAEVPVKTIIENPDQAMHSFKEVAVSMEVETLIPGCMSFSFLFAERGIDEVAGIPIVNPLFSTIRIAESLIL